MNPSFRSQLLGITFAGVFLVFQYFEVPSMFSATNFSLVRNASSSHSLSPDSSVSPDDAITLDTHIAPSNDDATTLDTRIAPSKDDATTLDTRIGPSKDYATTLDTRIAPSKDYATTLDTRIAPSKDDATTLDTRIAPSKDNATTLDTHTAPSGHNAYPANLNISSTSSVIVNKTAIPNQTLGTLRKNEDSSTLPAHKTSSILSISEMNRLLQHNHASPVSATPKWSSVVDQQLLFAKSHIQNAPKVNATELYAPPYRNVSMFKRSYELMDSILKVYVYEEGEKPIFHEPMLDGIYASEGWLMKLLEENEHFVTKDPTKAHLFYIPFSSRLLQLTVYKRNSHDRHNLVRYMKNYTDMIASKYEFWNRTDGADHFLAACHDWAPTETRGRMLNCIRALCNADIKVGFTIGKDVSLPETYVRSPKNPLMDLGGNIPSQRPILAFFAGNLHGSVRPSLSKYWENKDPDMKISGPLPHVKGDRNYIEYMRSSKYCICAKGLEVNSPRVVEAIMYECVPVIISDNFVPPLFGVLNWESFAIFVEEKDIPKLKNVLMSVSEERYMEMYARVKKIQQHFVWHVKPVKYDLFHMILHSLWYNRIFQLPPA